MFKSLFLSLSNYPLPDRSPEAAAIKYRSRNFIQVRGNVFARLNGILSKEDHDKYMAAARDVDDLDKYLNKA